MCVDVSLVKAFSAKLKWQNMSSIIDINARGLHFQATLFEGCTKGFCRMLSLNIKPKLFLPKQIVITKGDVDHQMYFVHKGEVEVHIYKLVHPSSETS